MTQAEFNQMLQAAVAGNVAGGYYMSRWKGEEIDAMLSGGPWVPASGYVPASNPNLLDNWYFLDPINQRGETEYRGARYGIDRWYGRSANTRVLLDTDGIVVTTTSGDSDVNFRSIIQKVSNSEGVKGKTLTLSCMIAQSTAVGIMQVTKNELGSINQLGAARFSSTDRPILVSFSFSAPNEDFENLLVQIGISGPHALKIIAIKLELGTKQTLAHQNEDGSWALNDPPPNKALELLKCMQYQIQIVNPVYESRYGVVGRGYGDSASQGFISIPLPTKCNGNPTLFFSGDWRLYPIDGSLGDKWINGIPVTSMKCYYTEGTQCNLVAVTNPGAVTHKEYLLVHVPPPAGTRNSLLLDMNL